MLFLCFEHVARELSASCNVFTAKRAETRECPICHELIPLRLLGQHVELETERVQSIIDHVGDLAEFADPYAAGTSSEYAMLAVYMH